MPSCKRSCEILAISIDREKIEVLTDHKPSENLNLKCRTDDELGDMTYYLSQYDLETKYAPGKYNLEADCLSRNLVLEPNEEKGEEKLKIVNLITIKDIKEDKIRN